MEFEIAINYADRKIYGRSGDNIVVLAEPSNGGGGGGDTAQLIPEIHLGMDYLLSKVHSPRWYTFGDKDIYLHKWEPHPGIG